MARILVVEPEKSASEFIVEIVRRYAVNKYVSEWSLRFTEVSNSAEALDRIKEHNFELIISDISIARADNWEFIRVLRKGTDHFDLPIVVVSAIGGIELEYMSKRAGASMFFTKPLEPKKFVDDIFTLIMER